MSCAILSRARVTCAANVMIVWFDPDVGASLLTRRRQIGATPETTGDEVPDVSTSILDRDRKFRERVTLTSRRRYYYVH
jgi:hypothetical protein